MKERAEEETGDENKFPQPTLILSYNVLAQMPSLQMSHWDRLNMNSKLNHRQDSILPSVFVERPELVCYS